MAENDRDEQRELIKYSHLLANCLVFYNVCTMTNAHDRVRKEDMPINAKTGLSPYLTDHVNRFGEHELDLNREHPPVDDQLPILGY